MCSWQLNKIDPEHVALLRRPATSRYYRIATSRLPSLIAVETAGSDLTSDVLLENLSCLELCIFHKPLITNVVYAACRLHIECGVLLPSGCTAGREHMHVI